MAALSLPVRPVYYYRYTNRFVPPPQRTKVAQRLVPIKSDSAAYADYFSDYMTTSQGSTITNALAAIMEYFQRENVALALRTMDAVDKVTDAFRVFWDLIKKAGASMAKKFKLCLDKSQEVLLSFISWLCSNAKSLVSHISFHRLCSKLTNTEGNDEALTQALHDQNLDIVEDKLKPQAGDEAWYVSYPALFLSSVLGIMEMIGNTITQFDKGASAVALSFSTLSGIFKAAANSATYIKGFNVIKYLIDTVYHYFTGSHCFTVCQFVAEFEQVYAECADLAEYFATHRNPSSGHIRTAAQKLNLLQNLYIHVIQYKPTEASSYKVRYDAMVHSIQAFSISPAAESRMKPIALCLRGDAGCGKSLTIKCLVNEVMPLVYKYFHPNDTAIDIPVFQDHKDRATCLTINCSVPKKTHDDGYARQLFYVYNELYTSKSAVDNKVWCDNFFSVIDGDPLSLHMAFSEKGKMYFDSPFVFASGNFQHHKPEINDPEAYFRRLELDVICSSTPASKNRQAGSPFYPSIHSQYKLSNECIRVHMSDKRPTPILYQLHNAGVFDMDKPFSYQTLKSLIAAIYVDRITYDSINGTTLRSTPPGGSPNDDGTFLIPDDLRKQRRNLLTTFLYKEHDVPMDPLKAVHAENEEEQQYSDSETRTELRSAADIAIADIWSEVTCWATQAAEACEVAFEDMSQVFKTALHTVDDTFIDLQGDAHDQYVNVLQKPLEKKTKLLKAFISIKTMQLDKHNRRKYKSNVRLLHSAFVKNLPQTHIQYPEKMPDCSVRRHIEDWFPDIDWDSVDPTNEYDMFVTARDAARTVVPPAAYRDAEIPPPSFSSEKFNATEALMLYYYVQSRTVKQGPTLDPVIQDFIDFENFLTDKGNMVFTHRDLFVVAKAIAMQLRDKYMSSKDLTAPHNPFINYYSIMKYQPDRRRRIQQNVLTVNYARATLRYICSQAFQILLWFHENPNHPRSDPCEMLLNSFTVPKTSKDMRTSARQYYKKWYQMDFHCNSRRAWLTPTKTTLAARQSANAARTGTRNKIVATRLNAVAKEKGISPQPQRSAMRPQQRAPRVSARNQGRYDRAKDKAKTLNRKAERTTRQIAPLKVQNCIRDFVAGAGSMAPQPHNRWYKDYLKKKPYTHRIRDAFRTPLWHGVFDAFQSSLETLHAHQVMSAILHARGIKPQIMNLYDAVLAESFDFPFLEQHFDFADMCSDLSLDALEVVLWWVAHAPGRPVVCVEDVCNAASFMVGEADYLRHESDAVFASMCQCADLSVEEVSKLLFKSAERPPVNPLDIMIFICGLIGAAISVTLIAVLIKAFVKKDEVVDPNTIDALRKAGYDVVPATVQSYEPQLDDPLIYAKPKRKEFAALFDDPTTSQGANHAQILNKIIANQYAIECYGQLAGTMTFVFAQVAFCNAHVWDSVRTEMFHAASLVKRNGHFDHIRVAKSQIKVLQRIEEEDLIILGFPTIRPHSDISTHISDVPKATYSASAIVHYDTTDGQVHADPAGVPVWFNKPRNFNDTGLPMYVSTACTYSFVNNEAGKCGSLLVGYTRGDLRIIAMHGAGSLHSGFGIGLTRSLFARHKVSSSTPIEQLSAVAQCGMNFADEHPLGTYTNNNGDFTCPLSSAPTGPTVFAPTVFTELSFNGGPPKRPAATDNIAYKNALAKQASMHPLYHVNPEVYQFVLDNTDTLAARIFPVDESVYIGCRTLTLDEALYGYPGLGNFKKQSSTGVTLLLHNLDKVKLLEGDPETLGKARELDAKFEKAIAEGDFPFQVCLDKLKDELRDHERVNQKKTRVFNITDFFDNVQIKKALGDLVSKLENVFIFGPPSCGVNPASSLWRTIYNEFVGLDMMCADVSGFDSTHTALLFPLIDKLIDICYVCPREALRAKWAYKSCIYALRFAYGKGRLDAHGNSSGNWITTFLNTIYNICYFMISTCMIVMSKDDKATVTQILDQLITRIYSDDNMVANRVYKVTPLEYSRFFLDKFGITLTSVSKGEITPNFIKIDDAEFLSRGFAREFGLTRCPLARDSVLSQLYYVRVPKTKRCDQAFIMSQLLINVDNVCRETIEYTEEDAKAIYYQLLDFIKTHNLPIKLPWKYLTDRQAIKTSTQ